LRNGQSAIVGEESTGKKDGQSAVVGVESTGKEFKEARQESGIQGRKKGSSAPHF